MWLKILRQRKLQTIMIFLIVMLCTTLLTGAVSILTSLDKPFKSFSDECNTAAARIYTFDRMDDTAKSMGEQFKKLDSVKDVLYPRKHYIDEDFTFNGRKIEAFTNITEYSEDIFGKVRYLEGSRNSAETLADNECILPACISNEYKIHIGDKVTVKFAQQDVTYTVKAVYTDPYQTSTAFDCDMLVKSLPDFASTRLDIYLYGKDGAEGKLFEEAYREKYNGQMNGKIENLEDVISDSLIAGNIVGAVFLAIGVIMLLVSGLMIYYMIKNAMIIDAKSIAIYKTIGYTSNEILFMYLKFYFLIVSVACAMGIGGSVIISNKVLTSIFENMGKSTANNPLLPGTICYILVVSFVISIITSIISESRRVKPVAVLSGMDFGGIKKKKRYKGNSKLQFSPLGIAYRNFARSKKNAVSIVLTCIVTIFSVNFAVISLDTANTMKDNNDYWLGIDKSDVMISVPESGNYDFVREALKDDPRVDHYLENAYLNTVTMKWKKGMTDTYMSTFTYDDFSKANLPVVKGRNPSSGNEIAISTKMAEGLNKNVGDYLEVFLDGKKQVNLLITGLFQSYMQLGTVCRLTSAAYTENNVEYTRNNFSVYLKNNKDTVQFIDDIKGKIGGRGNAVKRTEQYGSIMNMIVTPQEKGIPPVVALVLLVAGINIFSIIMLNNVKSQKTNGIYKCIGYTTWHLILSNIYYVGSIAILSIGVAMPLTMATHPWIMKKSLSVFSFLEFPVQYNMAHIAIANLGIFLVFILSTLVSSGALFRVNVRDLVQE